MNAAQHAAAAELLLAKADRDGFPAATFHLAAAQVQATLAVAAAHREALDLTRLIYGPTIAAAEAAQTTCGEVCCSPGSGAHACTQIAGHGGRHVSPHTTWGDE